MTVLRVIFFRLHESPRYLVAAGRPTEAMENLHLISRFNGEELDLSLRDVRDHFGTVNPLERPSRSLPSLLFTIDQKGNKRSSLQPVPP